MRGSLYFKLIVIALMPIYSGLAFAEMEIASEAPLALVYNGYGICPDDCAKGAADSAKLAGFQTLMVGGGPINPELLSKASVWLQPGGFAVESARSMGATLLQQIRNFVAAGGGYVGFCAGAFLATAEIGTSGYKGLGIMPGRTSVYEALGSYAPAMLRVRWLTGIRQVYWEGGPFIRPNPNDAFKKIIALYPNGQVATASSKYGKGSVIVTGLHPEAPDWWAPDEGLSDGDGSEQPIVAELIRQAAKSANIQNFSEFTE
jgi:glutamine amidotransferase-like uncharacterized protein